MTELPKEEHDVYEAAKEETRPIRWERKSVHV